MRKISGLSALLLLSLATLSLASVDDFYSQWKGAYFKYGCCDGCAYVQYQSIYQQTTVSEAIGYGMLFAVATSHQADFDALYKYYVHYPSDISGTLMSWKQTNCQNVEGSGAASDADLDAALALVLAAEKWGSSSTFNYASEAHKMLAAIKQWELAPQGYMWVGNWGSSGSFREVSRSTDFSPAHFRKFAQFSNDEVWNTAIEWGYTNFDQFQK